MGYVDEAVEAMSLTLQQRTGIFDAPCWPLT